MQHNNLGVELLATVHTVNENRNNIYSRCKIKYSQIILLHVLNTNTYFLHTFKDFTDIFTLILHITCKNIH